MCPTGGKNTDRRAGNEASYCESARGCRGHGQSDGMASRGVRGGLRIRTGADGAERGSERPEPSGHEGGGGARSQSSSHGERDTGRRREGGTEVCVCIGGFVEAKGKG